MKSQDSPPLCSLLTSRAPSGIAVVLLRGSGSSRILRRTFRRPSGKGLPPAHRAAYGFIRSDQEILDEVLLIRAAPEPEERFEVCCHGGAAAALAVADLFAAFGARLFPWSRLVGKGTLEYELFRSLLAAQGEEQALVLAHFASGSVEALFADLLARIEAGGASFQEGGSSLLKRLKGLLETWEFGRYLDDPPRTVLVGPSNAGKSTLFNAILGEDRALTSPFPGTTRDPVEAFFLLHGFPVRLVDAAGPPPVNDDPLFESVAAAAAEAEAEADLVVRLIGDVGEEARVKREESGKKEILVLSKCDLPHREETLEARCDPAGGSDVLKVSALTGKGIDGLLDRMSASLRIDDLKGRAEPLLWTRRQVLLIRKCAAALESGRGFSRAATSLRRYLGRSSPGRGVRPL